MEKYRKRVVDDLLALKLESSAAVLVEGAKWCGKTTTCRQIAKSFIYMDEPEFREQNIARAQISPSAILDGAHPRLIDEWQIAPQLWDAIRHRADRDGVIGGYLITGSAVPVDIDELKHSGTGRFSWLKMRPMSLWESGESSGSVSMGGLFAGETAGNGAAQEHELEEIAELVCRGGWPQSLAMTKRASLAVARNVFDAIVNHDISRVDGVARDCDRARSIMRSYARLQGTQATARVIKSDLAANEMMTIDDDTVYSYLNAMRKIFIVEDMPAWCPNLRTKDAVRSAETRYFVDPSIAVAAMGTGPGELMNDLKTLGLFFETLAIRDLRVYADFLDGEVRHYRDRSGLECDAVVHLRNGEYALIEIKLGGAHLIEEGVKTLTALDGLIRSKKAKPPAFRMIMTAVGQFAYRRPEDGILVCPIGCLKM